MTTVLYLHGLASSPKGRKAALLAERLSKDGFRIAAPDLNAPSFARLDFDAIVRRATEAAREEKPDVIVGSSLGALVALAVVSAPDGPRVPLVLVAPALAFGDRWSTKLPETEPLELYHHGEGRSLPIHRQFFEGMASVRVDDAPPPVPVSVVMGTDDESVPIAQVRETWERWSASGRLAPGSAFHEVKGGDHGLVAHGAEIEAAVRERLAACRSAS